MRLGTNGDCGGRRDVGAFRTETSGVCGGSDGVRTVSESLDEPGACMASIDGGSTTG